MCVPYPSCLLCLLYIQLYDTISFIPFLLVEISLSSWIWHYVQNSISLSSATAPAMQQHLYKGVFSKLHTPLHVTYTLNPKLLQQLLLELIHVPRPACAIRSLIKSFAGAGNVAILVNKLCALPKKSEHLLLYNKGVVGRKFYTLQK